MSMYCFDETEMSGYGWEGDEDSLIESMMDYMMEIKKDNKMKDFETLMKERFSSFPENLSTKAFLKV